MCDRSPSLPRSHSHVIFFSFLWVWMLVCARVLHNFFCVCSVHHWCMRLTIRLRYIDCVAGHVCYGADIIFRTLYSRKWQRSSHIRYGIVLFLWLKLQCAWASVCACVLVCNFSVLLFYALYFIALMSAYPLNFISTLCFCKPNALTQTEPMIWFSCFDCKMYSVCMLGDRMCIACVCYVVCWFF